MKQFNLIKFETYPNGNVILYSRDGRQMLIKRLETGTKVATAMAPVAGGSYPFGSDGSLAMESTIHRTKISDIPFKRAVGYWSPTGDDSVCEILI